MKNELISKIIVIIILALIFIIAGCTSKQTQENSSNENQNNLVEQQWEIYNGQRIVGELGNPNSTHAFTSSELTAAENALAIGIKIDDPQNDWVRTPDTVTQHDSKPDNLNPYPLPWTDLNSVSVGADYEYIYFKFQFWGNIPREIVTYNGDRILGGGYQVRQMTFGSGEYDWAQLQIGLHYTDCTNESLIATMPQLHHEAMISPTGETDENGETVYSIFSREGLIGGGADTDYLLAAYPLKLFNLSYGDNTTFNFGAEFTSDIYHHCAIEHLLDSGNPKAIQGATIQYTIGSDTYTNLGVPPDAYIK